MEKLKQEAIEAFRTGLVLVATGLLLWALGLIGAQCLGWLRFGMWQQVPAYAVFLGPFQQGFMLTPIGLSSANWSPLMLVPSFANLGGADEVAAAVAGNLAGLVKIISAVLQWPLSAWLLGMAFAFLTWQTALESGNRSRID